jgi:hypothetical protein
VGAGCQGQRLGKSRFSDRRADQGAHAPIGPGERVHCDRSAAPTCLRLCACAARGRDDRLSHDQACRHNACRFVCTSGDIVGSPCSPHAGSGDCGSSASSCHAAGRHSGRTGDPRLLACGRCAAGGPACTAADGFWSGAFGGSSKHRAATCRHAAAAVAPRGLLRNPTQRRTTLCPHVSPRGAPAPRRPGVGTGPAPRGAKRSTGVVGYGTGFAAAEAGGLHVVGGNPDDGATHRTFSADARRPAKAGNRGRQR